VRPPSIVIAGQNLQKQYEAFKKEFQDNLAIQNYDYLLGTEPDKFPAKLRNFKDTVLGPNPDNTAAGYSQSIQNYLNSISVFQKTVSIPFTVTGADGGENGYSLFFDNSSDSPGGDIVNGSGQLQFRLPISQPLNIVVRKGGSPVLNQSYTIPPGYGILGFNNTRLPFLDPKINIRLIFQLEQSFLPIFSNKL
jgi:hypothetical protein